jgi:hypothetical protein
MVGRRRFTDPSVEVGQQACRASSRRRGPALAPVTAAGDSAMSLCLRAVISLDLDARQQEEGADRGKAQHGMH